MSATNFNNVLVAITVLSIAKEGHSCNVQITFDSNGKKETTILDDCFISGLAKYRFNDPNNDKFIIGKEYTAENTSKDYQACPVKIKRTCGTKTGKLMYALSVLNEAKATPFKTCTPKGNVINGFKFNTIPSRKWKRYSDFYEENLALYNSKQKAVATV